MHVLQANAKWWHILASHGVKIDPRTFQSPDVAQRDAAIRAVVPELLERNGMALEQAVDYCRQFDVEPEFASLTYIEKLLLQVGASAASPADTQACPPSLTHTSTSPPQVCLSVKHCHPLCTPLAYHPCPSSFPPWPVLAAPIRLPRRYPLKYRLRRRLGTVCAPRRRRCRRKSRPLVPPRLAPAAAPVRLRKNSLRVRVDRGCHRRRGRGRGRGGSLASGRRRPRRQ